MKTKYRITLWSITVSILLFSCRINGSFQGLYSYYNKSIKNNPSLFAYPDPATSICELTNNDSAKIYVINGKGLKNCLIKKQDAIVYVWGPRCKSKICYPLDVLQDLCNKNNITLYIVAEYYDVELMKITYNIENPIFGIDTRYYNSNLTSKYLEGFIKDMTLQETVENKFYYFEQGVFINSFKSIENSINSIRETEAKSIYNTDN